MSASREERMVRNEILFREVNEQIERTARTMGGDQHEYEYICECADPGCAERIVLTFEQYERVRSGGSRFLLAPGHEVPGLEGPVIQAAEHQVVEKVGHAGAVAEQFDPRAN